MSAETPEEIKKHVTTYMVILGTLLLLTLMTVAVSYMSVSVIMAIVLAVSIASLKSSLVAGFFMHLLGEKGVIYWVLFLCVILFLPLILVPVLSHVDSAGEQTSAVVITADTAEEDHGEEAGDEVH